MMTRCVFLSGVALAVATTTREGRAFAGPITIDKIGDQVQTLPRGQLPEFAKTADIRRLYQYAVERGDELKYMPCFCGCVNFGHVSNRDCYIKSVNGDGTITFTSHAAT